MNEINTGDAMVDRTTNRNLAKMRGQAQEALVQNGLHITVDAALAQEAELRTLKAKVGALEAKPAKAEVTVNLKEPKPAKIGVKQVHVPAMEILAAVVLAECTRRYDHHKFDEVLHKVFPGEEYATARRQARRFKAHTDTGTTTDPSFGAGLVDHDLGKHWTDLEYLSAAAQLRNYGNAVDLQNYGSVTIPLRDTANKGDLAPAFVAENATIPVLQGTLSSATIVLNKLAAITTMTRELVNVSNALAVIRAMMEADLSSGLDGHLFDPANAALAGVRPAAITYGATNQASAGDDIASIVADLKWLRSQLTFAHKPCVVMHKDRVDGLQMLLNDLGIFPFAEMVAKGNLFGMKLISSPYVPADNVVGVDAHAFYSTSHLPEIDLGQTASLVMVDADGVDPTMMDLGAVNLAGSVAVSDAADVTGGPAEVVSTFQQNALALRLVQPIGWGLVTSSAVSYLSGVSW